MSAIVNKVKEVLHHDHNATTTTGTTTSGTHTHAGHTAGPHNTDTANKIDPRIDSDLDGSRTVGNNNTYGTTGNTGYAGTSGATGTTIEHHHHHHHHDGAVAGTGAGLETHHNRHQTTTTAGPHDSNVANKLDPRVDSDRDGSSTIGNNSNTYGSSTGVGSNNATYNHSTTGSAAPPVHNSALLNKLDPRVPTGNTTTGTGVGHHSAGTNVNGQGQFHKDIDSLDGTSGTGVTGNTYNTTGNGPHSSSVANKLDPRVDSTTGMSNTTGAGYSTNGGYSSTTGTGAGFNNSTTGNGYMSTTGTNTGVGPHSSSLANKLDPRVDSTTGQSNTTGNGYSTTGNHGIANGGYTGTTGNGVGYDNSTTGTGYGSGAHTGTGPVHNSALANKLDPRVDSHPQVAQY